MHASMYEMDEPFAPPWFVRKHFAAMTGEGGHGRGHGRGRGHRHGRGFGPGGAFMGPGPFFGRGPKVGRGDVRAAILALLAEEPLHGYQIIQELESRSGGVWRPSPGSIYPTLQQLEDEGLIVGEEAEGKRVFHLTEAGRSEAERRPEGSPAPWEDVAGVSDSLLELRGLVFQVGAAVMQVAQAGSEVQVVRAKEILAHTRKALYRVLAEDEPATPGSEEG